MLATFMEVLDTSIASVALPHIAGNLGATQDEATWVLTSYLVSNAIVLPASAWFSSFFGRKRFLIGCIIIFTTSSFLCGVATSLGMSDCCPRHPGRGRRRVATAGASDPAGELSAGKARRGHGGLWHRRGCAPIIGPTLGGWLTDSYSWRWAFYINIPVGILAVFLISMFVEDPPYIAGKRSRPIDAIGFGLLASGWPRCKSPSTRASRWIGLGRYGCAGLWAFRWPPSSGLSSGNLHAPAPVVDLRILKNRNFAIGCVLFTLFGMALYALVALQPLFLQSLLGYTAFDAGLTVSPRGLGALIGFFVWESSCNAWMRASSPSSDS